jgi:hypothetical protein
MQVLTMESGLIRFIQENHLPICGPGQKSRNGMRTYGLSTETSSLMHKSILSDLFWSVTCDFCPAVTAGLRPAQIFFNFLVVFSILDFFSL